jgi:hypothetical protein
MTSHATTVAQRADATLFARRLHATGTGSRALMLTATDISLQQLIRATSVTMFPR